MSIGQAGGERVFGADDDELDLVLPDEFFELVELHHADGNILRDLRGAGVARRGKEAGHPRRMCQFPRQRMFPPAVADQ